MKKRKPGVGRQRGVIAPFLAAAIPALVAGGKAAAMEGQGAAANYGSIKALHALSKLKYKRKRRPQGGLKHDDGTYDTTRGLFKRCLKGNQPKQTSTKTSLRQCSSN